MSIDDFDGIKITKSKMAYIGALLGLLLIAYNGITDYNRRGFTIERLMEKDVLRSSEIATITRKLEDQTREITEMKIAVTRLADQLERQNGK